MKYKVLVTAPYFQLVVDRFREYFKQHDVEISVPKVDERLSEEELLPLVGDIDGILCGDDRITEKVLEAAHKLKVIVKWGTGIDSIDKEAASKRGIPVKNTPNAFTEPVADSVLGYILCFARDIINLDKKMKEGIWMKKMTTALNECTLGIIGLGNVGMAVRRRAEAFGMRVIAYDVREIGLPCMVPLDQLLAESDFISVNCDLNPTSRYLINKESLSKMKRAPYMVNAARGPIINEADLIEALENKWISGAALDVFEDEPLPQESPLRKMENVILSPHNTNGSPKAWEHVHKNSVENLIAELEKYNG